MEVPDLPQHTLIIAGRIILPMSIRLQPGMNGAAEDPTIVILILILITLHCPLTGSLRTLMHLQIISVIDLDRKK